MECRFPEGLAPKIPQRVIEAPSLGPPPSLGQGLSYTGDNIDFSLILDDLASTDIHDIDILDIDILDVDISARPALTWGDIDLDTSVQFMLPFLPSLDTATGDVVAGPFEPPWSPGHFLCSRFSEQDQRLVFRPAVVSLTERMMKTALRSYPNMMETGGVRLFVHSTNATHRDMKVTLENCASLVLLWKSQREFNKRFVSEGLERERSRLLSEVRPCLYGWGPGLTHGQYGSYSDHGMLAATLAVIIYASLEYLDPNSTESQVGCRHMPSILVSKARMNPRDWTE